MSLSDAEAQAVMTGRIFASGYSGPQERSFGDLSGTSYAAYAEVMESEYMERVRARATAAAKDILASAQAEAAILKDQARLDGLAEGRSEAAAEVDRRTAELGERLAGLLAGINAERGLLWEQSRQDYLAVLKLALEKTLNIEIDVRREEILTSLINQALERIDSQTMLTVTVNPEDEAMAASLLERAKAGNPELSQFRVRTDPAMNPGGIVLESQGGRVDNSLESRFAGVIEIISQFENVPDAEVG